MQTLHENALGASLNQRLVDRKMHQPFEGKVCEIDSGAPRRNALLSDAFLMERIAEKSAAGTRVDQRNPAASESLRAIS